MVLEGLQPFPLEKDHVKDPDGDGRIGKVENGAEENEMPVLSKEEVGQPAVVLPGNVDDGEVKHVHHLTMQPTGIMEHLPVKHAVDDVAHGSGSDEGETQHDAEPRVLPGQPEHDEEQGDHRHNPEDAQDGLHDAASAHPSEGHAWILDEQKLEPVAENGDLLANGHVGPDPNLKDLVNDQDDSYDDESACQALAFRLAHFFFSFILASRQIVVVGTQRSLSLGISLPVARQTP